MFDILPDPVRNFIDSIFAAPVAFLQLIIDTLDGVSLVAGRGINMNNYFGFFGYLPASWRAVVQSLLAMIVLLGMLWVIRAVWDMYMKVKSGVKWW